LEFKVATDDWEFEQIHQLNYRTFVEEIPQHERNPSGTLVDKFHADNTYFVCVQERRVLGMVCIRDKRPFSLDSKLDNLDSYLPPHQSACEVRLLSVEAKHRGGHVLKGLLKALEQHAVGKGYDLAVMSGLESQQKLYRHLGWMPFGPMVGSLGARYQPMYLTLEAFTTRTRQVLKDGHTARGSEVCVNLLPGPVQIAGPVRDAIASVPKSHRSDEFLEEFALTKQRLCRIAGSRSVEIFMGSGTLANDVVAGQLSLLGGRGVILSNGEFGSRLVNHATRWGLNVGVLEIAWGAVFEDVEIEDYLERSGDVAWLWAVHCETSTGVLNDLDALTRICSRRSIRLCVDCVSSIGTVPVNLSGVYLATGVSGKGLRAYPGLSMVFYNHALEASPDRLPCCLDLGLYAARDGVPYTISSNLLDALAAALGAFDPNEAYRKSQHLSAWLKSRLRNAGFDIVGHDAYACPAFITFAVPVSANTGTLGRRLEERGLLVSFNSPYLLERNWMQVALIGDVSEGQLEQLCTYLESMVSEVDRGV
jgi:aspartate aminotransferase-like enzyme